MMRAWISGETPGRGGLVLGERRRPDVAAGRLVVRVTASGLNFSDVLMIDGAYQVRPPRPFVPGQEVAGVVEAAPPGSGFEPGERVVAKVDWGGFAEYASVRPDMALRVPQGLDLTAALALPVVYTTSMVALTHCAVVRPGDWVLVHAAAGGVGLAAVEIAKARGARVIATAGGAAKLAVAAEHGADFGIDYRAEDFVAAVRALTGGHGADIVFDPVGGDVGEASLRAVARDGTLLVVGFASGRIPAFAANRLLLKRACAKGVYWNHDQDRELLERVGRDLMAMMRDGAIRPLVDDRYGFEALPQALDDLENRRSTGKLALRVAEP